MRNMESYIDEQIRIGSHSHILFVEGFNQSISFLFQEDQTRHETIMVIDNESMTISKRYTLRGHMMFASTRETASGKTTQNFSPTALYVIIRGKRLFESCVRLNYNQSFYVVSWAKEDPEGRPMEVVVMSAHQANVCREVDRRIDIYFTPRCDMRKFVPKLQRPTSLQILD